MVPRMERVKTLRWSEAGQITACGWARLMRRSRHGLLGAEAIGLLGAKARLIRRTECGNSFAFSNLCRPLNGLTQDSITDS
jgi:hypothetical protein